METPPKDIVGNVHALPVGRSAKSISRHFTKSYLAKSLKMLGCMLTTLSHNWSTVDYAMWTSTPSRLGRERRAWAIGYTRFPQLHSPKWRMDRSNGDCNTGLASPGAGHLCGKQLRGAKQPCKAPLDAIGRHVAWWRKACHGDTTQQIEGFPGGACQNHRRNSYLRASDALVPLPWDSQPAARDARVVHTTNIHISDPNGTDIWVDVRIGMAKPDCSVPKELTRMEQEKRREYGQGPSNPNTLFDGVVPVIFEHHGCPSPCAITFLYYILRRRVSKLDPPSTEEHSISQHGSQGESWPHVVSRQGQESQLNLASTQRVDALLESERMRVLGQA